MSLLLLRFLEAFNTVRDIIYGRDHEREAEVEIQAALERRREQQQQSREDQHQMDLEQFETNASPVVTSNVPSIVVWVPKTRES